jgi:hypothetical protein
MVKQKPLKFFVKKHENLGDPPATGEDNVTVESVESAARADDDLMSNKAVASLSNDSVEAERIQRQRATSPTSILYLLNRDNGRAKIFKPPSGVDKHRHKAQKTSAPDITVDTRPYENATKTNYYTAMNDNVEVPSKGPSGPGSWLLGTWLLQFLGSKREFEKALYPNDQPEKLMKEKIKLNDLSLLSKIGLFVCSSAVAYGIVFFVMAAGLTYGAVKEYSEANSINWDEQLKVAFAGSAYLFINDIPRLMETISGGQIIQDSCLHTGGSLAALVMTGNGMYYRWQTSEALLSDNTTSSSASLYDYGACSLHSLITGYDEYIEYGNDNRAYYNDGSNPCLVDENYFNYVASQYKSQVSPTWDYVVLADQSKRMASQDARYDTVDALVSVYAPLLLQSGATPVIVDTHAFWSTQTNMTGLTDVPTFTKLIYEGVYEYSNALESELGRAPVIIPIGVAYLLIWEENFSIWQKLFLSDGMHASIHGSYLFACVMYTKLFGHLPMKSISVPDHIEYLFTNSRKIIGQDNSYPSKDEASYLRNVAKRIVLQGVLPKSFSTNSTDYATGSVSSYNDDGYR